VRKFCVFQWRRIKHAWRGCWTRTKETAGVLGAALLWLLLWALSSYLREAGLIEGPTTLWGVAGLNFLYALASIILTFLIIFVVQWLLAPSRMYWEERSKNDVSTSFLAADHIYAESKWVKWKDGGETGLYETRFYLPIGNALSDGKTLERVQARIFLMGEPLLARVKETGNTEIDIRHGEWAFFQLGSLVSKEMHGVIHGGVEMDGERRKQFEHNIPLGALSFEVWEPSGKHAYGLGHMPANPGKFTLLVIVSANGVLARHIPITIDLTNNNPVSYS
jgi:hypothetical protein